MVDLDDELKDPEEEGDFSNISLDGDEIVDSLVDDTDPLAEDDIYTNKFGSDEDDDEEGIFPDIYGGDE